MIPVGGLRARLIHDNIYYLVRDALDDLNWLGPSLDHDTVYVRQTQIANSEAVRPNIVAVTVEDDNEEEAELGSLLTHHTWNYYIDVYAEDDALGIHLANDIKDILCGRFTTSVTRGGPDVEILDLRLATPVEIFSVSLENIDLNRSRFFEKAFQEHWWVISFQLIDTYATEED